MFHQNKMDALLWHSCWRWTRVELKRAFSIFAKMRNSWKFISLYEISKKFIFTQISQKMSNLFVLRKFSQENVRGNLLTIPFLYKFCGWNFRINKNFRENLGKLNGPANIFTNNVPYVYTLETKSYKTLKRDPPPPSPPSDLEIVTRRGGIFSPFVQKYLTWGPSA